MRGKDSVGDREWEESSTPIRETSAVVDRRKTEEAVGGGEELETDTEVGSTAEAQHEAHAIRPVEGQDKGMHTADGPHRATGDDGWIAPSRSEYEEESGDGETWHDAREDWWEEVAYKEAKTGGHEDKAREGSSTPAIEIPAVGASADVRRAQRMKAPRRAYGRSQ